MYTSSYFKANKHHVIHIHIYPSIILYILRYTTCYIHNKTRYMFRLYMLSEYKETTEVVRIGSSALLCE